MFRTEISSIIILEFFFAQLNGLFTLGLEFLNVIIKFTIKSIEKMRKKNVQKRATVRLTINTYIYSLYCVFPNRVQ